MEYTNIISVVPQGEVFDSSAVNEGVWMSVAHMNAVEKLLSDNAAAVASVKGQFDSEALLRQEAETKLVAANDSNVEKDNTISAQAEEIKTLKAGAAGKMKETGKENDSFEDKTVVESEVTKEANRLRAIRDGKK